jgi:hypothetical protein
LGHRGVVQQKAGKRFFFEKKRPARGSKKLLLLRAPAQSASKPSVNWKFFASFFQKRSASFLASATSATHERNLSFASSKAG